MSIGRHILFSLAKEIYALHCAINQLSHIPERASYRNQLIDRMNHSVKKFINHGGIVETGQDAFGEKGPLLSYPEQPKESIPYSIGRLECEKLLSI